MIGRGHMVVSFVSAYYSSIEWYSYLLSKSVG
jgi:hypothetical protein